MSRSDLNPQPVDVLAAREAEAIAANAEYAAQERAYLLREGGSSSRVSQLTQQILDSARWLEQRAAIARLLVEG